MLHVLNIAINELFFYYNFNLIDEKKVSTFRLRKSNAEFLKIKIKLIKYLMSDVTDLKIKKTYKAHIKNPAKILNNSI